MGKEIYEKPLFELITLLDDNIVTVSPEEGDVPEDDEDDDVVSMAKSLMMNILKPWIEDEEGNMWLTDEEGNILVDEEGNPIAYNPEIDGNNVNPEGSGNQEQTSAPEQTTAPENQGEQQPVTSTPEEVPTEQTNGTGDFGSQLNDALNEVFGNIIPSTDTTTESGGGGFIEDIPQDNAPSVQPESSGDEGAGW